MIFLVIGIGVRDGARQWMILAETKSCPVGSSVGLQVGHTVGCMECIYK